MGLPSFLIIGAAKAGTTSLHYYLDQHPQVAMSSVKETNFFTRPDFMEGLLEYEGYFAEGEDLVRGEASPWYTWHPYIPDVPERIHSLLPDAKLIYLVRDPVERAVAFYWEQFASNRAPEFDDAFADVGDPQNRYVCASKYALQVEQYLPFFGRDDLLVVDSADLLESREETLRTIFGFIGVDRDFTSPRFQDELNTIERKLQPTTAGRFLKGSAPARAIRRALPVKARSYLFGPVRRATSHKVVRRPLSDEARARLEEELRPDAERFRELTGKSFASWAV